MVEVSKEKSRDKLPAIHSENNRQKDIKLLLYQLKVPIVIILEIAVGTQIPKILKGFLCQDKIWLSMSKDGTY